MNTTNLKTRIIMKHDTEENWKVASNPGADKNPFIPYQSEPIVYDPDALHDYPRFKIGDGEHTPEDLPFLNEAELDNIYSKLSEKAITLTTADNDRIESGKPVNPERYDNFKNNFNRVYVERSGDRGAYGKYVLTYSPDSLAEDYDESKGPGSYLDSVPQRYGNGNGADWMGHIRVPAKSIEEFNNMNIDPSVKNQFAITRVYADTAIENNNENVIDPKITAVDTKIDDKFTDAAITYSNKILYKDNSNGGYSLVSCRLQNIDSLDSGTIFSTYFRFNGVTRGDAGVQLSFHDTATNYYRLTIRDNSIEANFSTESANNQLFDFENNKNYLLQVIENSDNTFKIYIDEKLILTNPKMSNGRPTHVNIVTTGATLGKLYFSNLAFYRTTLDIVDSEYTSNIVHAWDGYDLSDVIISDDADSLISSSYDWQILDRDTSKNFVTHEYLDHFAEEIESDSELLESKMPIIGTEFNLKNSTEVPESGQLVIYEPDENYAYYRIKTGDGKTRLDQFDSMPLTALPTVESLDKTRLQNYTADYVDDNGNIVDENGITITESNESSYYLNRTLYNNFRKQNRVYVERGLNSSGKWRGPYPMYTLSYNTATLKNPWLYKESWWEKYYNSNKTSLSEYATLGEYLSACRADVSVRPPAPKQSDFFGLDSVVQRMGDSDGKLPGMAGHIRVPSRTVDDFDALTIDKSISNEFAITRTYADSAITRNNERYVNSQIDKSVDNLITTSTFSDRCIQLNSENGVYSKVVFKQQITRDDVPGATYYGSTFSTYFKFDGKTFGPSGLQLDFKTGGVTTHRLLIADNDITFNYNYSGEYAENIKKIVYTSELKDGQFNLLQVVENPGTDLQGAFKVFINGKCIGETWRMGIGAGESELHIAATSNLEGKITFCNTAFFNEPDLIDGIGGDYKASKLTEADYYNLDDFELGNIPYSNPFIYQPGSYANMWQIVERDTSKELATKDSLNKQVQILENYVDSRVASVESYVDTEVKQVIDSLPTPTVADAGKFLIVGDDGKIIISEIKMAEGGEY